MDSISSSEGSIQCAQPQGSAPSISGTSWIRALVILCLYGFFKELRPSEPYLTPYLKSPQFKNLTEEEVNNEIYPVWTYSNLVALFIVLIFTDFLRHKPVIVFEGLAYIGTWVLLIWGEGVFSMKMMQLVYGLATSTEVAYYSYIYIIVSVQEYQKVSGYTRSAILAGRCASGVISQLVIGLSWMNYLELNYLSLSCVTVAFILSFFLPNPRQFHNSRCETDPSLLISNIGSEGRRSRDIDTDRTVLVDDDSVEQPNDVRPRGAKIPADDSHIQNNATSNVDSCVSSKVGDGCFGSCLKSELKRWLNEQVTTLRTLRVSYTDTKLLKWSVWWALASCGYYQIGNYGQNLWDTILPERDHHKIYNGGVEAVSTMLGALSAFLVGIIGLNWDKFGEPLLFLVSVLDAGLLIVMSQTKSIWLCYGLYGLFRAIYQLAITVASFQIAKHMSTDRYGLIFGVNTFLAVLLQTLITALVVDKKGLNVEVRVQFVIYGCYFAFIALIFGISLIVSNIRRLRSQQTSTE